MATAAVISNKETPAVISLDSEFGNEQPHSNGVKREEASQALEMGVQSNDDWESASMYEELYEEIDPDDYEPGADVCTPAEAKAYKDRLHEVGANMFVYETITSRKVTAKKLCTAFGVKLPVFYDKLADSHYYPLLGVAIKHEICKRRRLPQYKNIDDAARLLRKSKNIMIIAGAGISTSLGIPDFRSKNSGFYSKLQDHGFDDPEQVFDIENFDEDPTIFYSLAGDIIPDLRTWSPTHEFIRLVQEKGKLLTNYTQNIDNLESHAGIKAEKLVQCHGSWATATCRKCKYRVPGEDIFDDVRAQRVAVCKRCVEELKAPRPGMKRKRNPNGNGKPKKRLSSDDDDSDGEYDIPQPGPDITFFGEGLPEKFFERIRKHDRELVDLVIVIGTTLKVAPVSEIPQFISPEVPQIFISRDPIHHINFDINLLGDCDTIVAELCRRAGWNLQHKMLDPDQKIEVKPYEQDSDTHFTVKARRS
ncbi:hypothetical protein W97_00391 [Coniosporium apollinis CBS 100218]|uniref:Deacetylase sirtuin-type domain-containing protein n=1 Tax=Coniosporium apollinis (strain CBS 100218) TaxID=1168221 RepID=R7YHB0_CONA1|nr:uncharacterized protein W97_00391 [Coniosporium apollinis CBS 100218]EON61179.1 hypothetical protein W97_00391 [Coniosporium apollinis CBS 100218]